MSTDHATRPAKLVSRLAGALRVSLYLSCVSLGLCAWSAPAYFSATEQTLGNVGDRLLHELGPSVVGAPRAFTINGQLLLFASRRSALGVHEVLDRFHDHCTGSAPGTVEQVLPPEIEPQGPAAPQHAATSARDGARTSLLELAARLHVLRSESAAEGQLFCFARSKQRAGLGALFEDLRAFAASGDFAKLGALRHAVVRRHPGGGSRVLVVWSEGPLLLERLFPASGDAPGNDPAGVPRPPDTTRTLSAQGLDHPYGLWLYRAAQSSEALLSFYARELPKAGWRAAPAPASKAAPEDGRTARAFVRDGRALLVALDARADGQADLALVDMGEVGRSSAVAQAGLSAADER